MQDRRLWSCLCRPEEKDVGDHAKLDVVLGEGWCPLKTHVPLEPQHPILFTTKVPADVISYEEIIRDQGGPCTKYDRCPCKRRQGHTDSQRERATGHLESRAESE